MFVNCWPDAGEAEAVLLADEYQGAFAAAQAAFALGHRELAFLGGPRGDYAWLERQRGCIDAARAIGLGPAAVAQLYGDYSINSGYELTLRVMTENRPTALVCGNDRMAIGSLLAVQSLDLDCPSDVSIICFDDQPDVADQIRPGLATVGLPYLQMGRRAGQLLLEAPTDPNERLIMPTELIRRDSLGPPPAARRRIGRRRDVRE